MPNLNRVDLMGNLTRDPELKFTPKGTPVCQIGIAINRFWKNEQGEKMEETTFVDVESFGRQAEVIAEHFKKGTPIFITGRLKQDSWDDKQTGQKRYKMKVIAEAFEFLGGKREIDRPEADAAAAQRGQRASAPPPRRPSTPPPKPQDPDLDQPEDDIPF
jgi:single-strand DNA-binding protein